MKKIKENKLRKNKRPIENCENNYVLKQCSLSWLFGCNITQYTQKEFIL